MRPGQLFWARFWTTSAVIVTELRLTEHRREDGRHSTHVRDGGEVAVAERGDGREAEAEVGKEGDDCDDAGTSTHVPSVSDGGRWATATDDWRAGALPAAGPGRRQLSGSGVPEASGVPVATSCDSSSMRRTIRLCWPRFWTTRATTVMRYS
jgi:hypothetical protein